MINEISRREFVKGASLVAIAAAAGGPLSPAEATPSEAMIPTARGDTVAASKLGMVLPTELIIQESPEISINWPDNSWGAKPEAEQIAKVVAILNAAHAGGVGTILDRTIPGIGRNVPRMKQIAQQTKLNILVCTGFYTLYELPYYFHYRQEFPGQYPNQLKLEDFLARDIEKGIRDTGVRACAIKVISDKYGIEETPDVGRVFKASSIAHRRTGAPLVTHGVGIVDGRRHQKVFASHGVNLSRVVLGHQDRTPPSVSLEEFERALDAGSFLSFDGWGPAGPNPVASDPAGPEQNLQRVASLVKKGYVKQILLSGGWPIAFYDVFSDDFMPEDGIKPYMRVAQQVIPGLKALGVSDSQIAEMTHGNPQRMLSSLAQGGY
ncbi:MAG TPA: twin-arginine translocation signal domain-containing protein [Steroidobacteraceae bacterium]|nr:twin-arginine translocation signal domain-containing protein [Steroidobacteraceae bacterium]